jgi:hypothetical protein
VRVTDLCHAPSAGYSEANLGRGARALWVEAGRIVTRLDGFSGQERGLSWRVTDSALALGTTEVERNPSSNDGLVARPALV